MLKNLSLYLLFSLIVLISYIELSHFWVSCGGVNGTNRYIELPLLIVLLLLFYFPLKSPFKNLFLATIPILGLYVSYDIFFHFLARSPRLSDFSNASTLSDFSPLMSAGAVMIALLITLPLLYLLYHFKQNSTTKTFYSWIMIKVLALFGLFYYLGTSHFSEYLFKKFDYYNWSQAKTITKNGRFSSFLYYGLKSKQAKEKLTLYKHKKLDINSLLFGDATPQKRRNIYIVVLESFIDPRLLQDTTFSPSPLSENMQKYLIKGEFSYIISSVYGGGTAQSEFEILTGIPALAKVNSIEFNALEGKQISGFVNLLKQNGYHTHATIATNSGYFNSKDAYKSIGFDETIFLEERDDFQQKAGDKHNFDGDVYDYNIKKLKEQKLKTPYLHYTLGMYGHIPYDRNLALRPDIITTTHKDKRVQRVANQFYYRTKALAHYIDAILSFDADAIIFISSDHLPALLNNGITYTKPQAENIALLLVDGKAVNIQGKHYFDIPRVIWKILQNDDIAFQEIDAKSREEIYFKALSESLQ